MANVGEHWKEKHPQRTKELQQWLRGLDWKVRQAELVVEQQEGWTEEAVLKHIKM